MCVCASLSLPHTRLCHYLTHPLSLDFSFFLEGAMNIEGGGHTQQASSPSSKMHWYLPPSLVCSGAATISSFHEFSGSFCKKSVNKEKEPQTFGLSFEVFFLCPFSRSLFSFLGLFSGAPFPQTFDLSCRGCKPSPTIRHTSLSMSGKTLFFCKREKKPGQFILFLFSCKRLDSCLAKDLTLFLQKT